MFKGNTPVLSRRLQSYVFKYIILRIFIISLIAVGVLHLIDALVQNPGGKGPMLIHYIIIVVSFNLASEVQILLDRFLEKYLPIPEKYKLRLKLQLIAGIILLYLIHAATLHILTPGQYTIPSRTGIYFGLMFGLLFIYMFANSLIYTRFIEKWMARENKIKEMAREKFRMDYNSLQNQLNPHFLFNNLSVLKSLITYNKDAALKFTENFTDVYRYVLQCKDRELVSLREELDFMHSYIGLHKERLGDGLKVTFDIQNEDLPKNIAPLTLQLLFENAVKHNVAKSEKPLKVDISTKNGLLCVSNTLQMKNSTYSTKTGLNNLVKRYEMLSDHEVEILKDIHKFEVKVPLL